MADLNKSNMRDLNDLVQSLRGKTGKEDVGTGGKVYNRAASTLLFDEVVMTTPYEFPYWNPYFIDYKASGTSARIQSGKFNETMDKALEKGADPTVGLKAAAKSFQTAEVMQALLDRGADPATKDVIQLYSKIFPLHPAPHISAIEQAAKIGNVEGVRVMWDHINKNPGKYPDFGFPTLSAMAGNGHQDEVALYVVDRVKKDMAPADYKKILKTAMEGAIAEKRQYLIYELTDRGAENPGGRVFVPKGLQSKYDMSEKEQAGLTRAFIENLNSKTNISDEELQDSLRHAIDMGSAGAVRAALARGANPRADEGHLLKGMLRHENCSIEAFKVALEPIIATGTVRDKLLLVRIKEKFDKDVGEIPIEGKRGQDRRQIINYMNEVMKPLEAEGFTAKTPNPPGLTERQLDRIKSIKGLPAITQLDSVPQIYDQLMDRLKPADPVATAQATVPALTLKPQLTLAAPAFA